MKKILAIILILFSVTGYVLYLNFFQDNKIDNNDYLRIHVRANSNSFEDQKIKYEIKDKIVEYLYSIVATNNSKEELESALKDNFENLEKISDDTLHKANFTYTTNVKLCSEYFPVRKYDDDLTLANGIYDALIVELGSAKGNNWWCVIYPPICFVNADVDNSKKVVYESRIYNIIKKFF